ISRGTGLAPHHPAQGQAQVIVLGSEPEKPRRSVGTPPVPGPLFAERKEVFRVSAPHLLRGPTGRQFVLTELAEGLQEAIPPDPVLTALDENQRLIHQLLE